MWVEHGVSFPDCFFSVVAMNERSTFNYFSVFLRARDHFNPNVLVFYINVSVTFTDTSLFKIAHILKS